MSTLTITPADTPWVHRRAPVKITAVTGSRRAAHLPSTGEVLGPLVTHLDGNGEASITLPSTDDLEPEGCHYLVEVAGHQWRILLPSGSHALGDPAIAAASIAPAVLVPGPIGGQADVGPLAEMPATPPREGAMWFAVDDRGGTMWIESAGVWVQSGPAVGDVGGAVIASAAPTAIPSSVTIAAAATWYTLPGLTTATFEMPSRPVTVSLSQVYITGASGDVDPSATEIRIQSTVNGGSSWQDVLLPYRDTSNFVFDIFAAGSARLRVNAGETVQLRCAVRRGDTGTVLALAVDNSGLPLYPLLEARVG